MVLISWWKNRNTGKKSTSKDCTPTSVYKGGLVRIPLSKPICGGHVPLRNIHSSNECDSDCNILGLDDIVATAIVVNAITSDIDTYESSLCEEVECCDCDDIDGCDGE